MKKQPNSWQFDNSYARLPDLFWSKITLNPVKAPAVVLKNDTLAAELGVSLEGEADVLAGNRVPDGGEPIAQAYAGHQFGHLTMLGDGRAVLLGEHITPGGQRVDIQLKGSGPTPFSRGGDGRAALGPMLREFIISEAMHGLGIPTTRSLAVTLTGEDVYRETALAGAVLTRVAASHLRVGTFVYAAGAGEKADVDTLVRYTIDRHYPGLGSAEELMDAVIARQAELIAKWQLVGFIHGVMNTDNMSIAGETIDYGPCAFMDQYDPHTWFSSIDTQGRYAYKNQPPIAGWNLARFAETLLPLLHDDQEQAVERAQEALNRFMPLYDEHYMNGMRAKLGLTAPQEGDRELVGELLQLMHETKADYTNTFRALTIGEALPDAFSEWQTAWQARLQQQGDTKEAVTKRMKQHNPAVIPRNHRVEEAIQAAVERGDYSVTEKLLNVLRNPYAYSGDQDDYATLPAPTLKPYRTFCGT